MKKLEEQTTFDILLNVALIGLIPVAILGIWFLATVKWWL